MSVAMGNNRIQQVNWEDELYREIIMDHYANPRHVGDVANADITVHGVNPLCGDDLKLSASVRAGSLKDLKIHTKGCSISQASSSIMAEALYGKTLAEAQTLVSQFKAMMLEGKPASSLPPPLADAQALEGVKDYPVRIKCALLAWNSALQGLTEFARKKSKISTSVTEKTEDDVYGKQ